MRAILTLFLALPLTAAMTCNDKTVLMRASLQGTLSASNFYLELNGTGAWSITDSGTLAGNMSYPVSSGTDEAMVLVKWDNQLINSYSTVGSRTGTVDLGMGNGTCTVTLQTVAAEPYYTLLPASASGCVDSSGNYSGPEACTISDERPTGSHAEPAVGATDTSGVFGSTAKRVSPALSNAHYTARRAISDDNLYILAVTIAGVNKVYSAVDGSELYTGRPGNIAHQWWSRDPTETATYLFVDGGNIKKHILTANGGAGDTSTIAETGCTTLENNTYDITPDGWLALRCDTNTLLIVDTIGLTTANDQDRLKSIDASGHGLTNWDSTLIWDYDPVAGVRFILINGMPFHDLYSYDGSTITYLGPRGETPDQTTGNNDGDGICETGENCYGTDGLSAHMGAVSGADGQSYLLMKIYDFNNVTYYIGLVKVSADTDMFKPVETGGGLRLILRIPAWSNGEHFGGSAGYGILSIDDSGGGSEGISTATAANPSRIQTASNHGWSEGETIVINKATGGTFATCLNGTHTVSIVDADEVDVDTADCAGAGTYTATGIASSADVHNTNPYHNEVMLIDIDGGTITRVAHHRGVVWNNIAEVGFSIYSAFNYYTTKRVSLSADASLMVGNTNYGYLDHTSIYTWTTGVTAPVSTGVTVTGVVSISGGVTIR